MVRNCTGAQDGQERPYRVIPASEPSSRAAEVVAVGGRTLASDGDRQGALLFFFLVPSALSVNVPKREMDLASVGWRQNMM